MKKILLIVGLFSISVFANAAVSEEQLSYADCVKLINENKSPKGEVEIVVIGCQVSMGKFEAQIAKNHLLKMKKSYAKTLKTDNAEKIIDSELKALENFINTDIDL